MGNLYWFADFQLLSPTSSGDCRQPSVGTSAFQLTKRRNSQQQQTLESKLSVSALMWLKKYVTCKSSWLGLLLTYQGELLVEMRGTLGLKHLQPREEVQTLNIHAGHAYVILSRASCCSSTDPCNCTSTIRSFIDTRIPTFTINVSVILLVHLSCVHN
jgi:hypothetical protein